jgi:tRNA(fMet)-specific endonuclease VapC
MSFLLDTNICSAYLKGDARVFQRFIQHSGGLFISTISLGELYSWVYRARTAPKRLVDLQGMLPEVRVLDVDQDVAHEFGRLRAQLLDQGHPTPTADLLIASTAQLHDLTLVTHNVQDFRHVPNLRIEDWLSP